MGPWSEHVKLRGAISWGLRRVRTLTANPGPAPTFTLNIVESGQKLLQVGSKVHSSSCGTPRSTVTLRRWEITNYLPSDLTQRIALQPDLDSGGRKVTWTSVLDCLLDSCSAYRPVG